MCKATIQCIIICGSEIYLSIFLSIASIALYICMCCFSVSKCPPYYIVHMQKIWTLCFRFYCLFSTWWLICTPTSPAPLSIHIVVILCYDDVDISNEGTCCFNAKIIWGLIQQNGEVSVFYCMQRGTITCNLLDGYLEVPRLSGLLVKSVGPLFVLSPPALTRTKWSIILAFNSSWQTE